MASEQMQKWFKKEGYLFLEVPATQCGSLEYPFPADIPPFYPIMALRCYHTLCGYFSKAKLP